MQFFSPSYSRFRGNRQLFARTSFRVLTLFVVLCSLAAAAGLLLSQLPTVSAATTVPTKMNFQGRLTDASGNIKPNGIYNMRFKLFTVATAGTNVWSEDRLVSATEGVQVTNGLFSVQLGSVTALPASLFASGALYLEVELPTPASATTSSPVWTEGPMTPRNQMATSAYAYNSETLDGQDGDYYTNAANLTGTVSAARLSGSYTGITGTGALTAGSIATGFGAIVTNNTISGTQLISTVATGTAPLSVTSTTLVTNLNADLLDGQTGTYYTDATNLTGTIASARLSGSYTGVTGTGALSAGSIASGFGTIATGDTITGTTINGTTGINTGAGSGTQRIDASGNLVNVGNITANGSLTFNGSGVGTYDNAIDNPGFETGNEDHGWVNNAAFTLESTDTRTGNYAVTATSTGANFYYEHSADIQVQPGENWYGEVWMKSIAAAGQGSLRFAWYQKSGAASVVTPNTYPGFASTTADTWTKLSGLATAPSDAAFLRIFIRVGSGTTGVVHKIDDIYAKREVDVPSLNILGTTVLTTGRVLQNVTTDASILTSGTISSARLTGSYTSITGTGALTAGSIGTGFGTILTGNTISGTQLTSTVATGTAPLVVSSTTKVTNLNVDLLDGLDSTAFAAASGSGSYIQNTTNPQTASMNITGSATVGSMTVNGNLVVASSTATGINGSGTYVSFHTGRAWDGAYEYLGFNSGSTRQGILLYDGSWAGCRSVSYEVCLKAENDNDLTLVSEWDVYLWAKGGAGDIHLNAGSGQILAVNNGTNANPAYSFTSNQGMGMYVNSAGDLALGTSSTARLVLSSSSAELWMGTTQRAERMCHNRGNAPTAGLAIIGDCSAGGSDFAEYYGSPGDVPVATIVEYDEAKPIEYLVDPTDTSRMGNRAFVKTATNRSKSLGVYSTNPFVDILGKEYYSSSDNIIPIGLAGRVPVRVNASNGSIAVGDPIALSSTPGVGAKAVTSGQIIGYSMQAYSGEGEGTVVALISTGYWAPSDMDTLQGQSAEVNSLTVSGMASIAGLNVSGTATLRTLAVTGSATIEGTLTVAGNVKTGNLTVNGRLISGGKTPTAAGSAATTVVLDGTDTAGSLTIVAKNLESLTTPVAKVTFSEAYPSAFRTVLSATNESATDLRVYIKKTKDGFEVFSRDALRPGVEYVFDYIVVGTE